MITLRQLTYLEVLSRHLHFGRAALECSISQPALSVQIRELEETLGLPLFERGRKGVVATQYGLEVAIRARKILQAVSDLGDYARGSTGMAGQLRIGIIPTIAPYILPKMLPLLNRAFPQMEPMIRESRTEHLVDELANGNLDIAIAALPFGGSMFSLKTLFDDQFVLAIPADRQPPSSNADLSQYIKNDHLLLLEEGHCLRDQALRHCDVAGVEYGKIYGTSNITTLVQMVSNGLGITILPKLCLPLEMRKGAIELIEFSKPVPYRVIGIGWRKSSPNSHHFETIATILKSIR